MIKPTKTITPSVRLQALGLFTLASSHYAKLRAAELEMIRLLGQEDQGCLSDAIYGSTDSVDAVSDFDAALANDGFVVEPATER